jgi:hypothetical protein
MGERWDHSGLNDMGNSKAKLITISALLILYFILFNLFGQLGFPIRKDEIHYWPVSLRFSEDWIPSVDLLKSYDELSTPLSFIIFGTIEHLFHRGIFAGRLLNLLSSLGILSIIVFIGEGRDRKYLCSVIGVLIYPYFIGCFTHLYTDIIATFFVFMGFLSYLNRLNLMSCLFFVLAISSRQYMLAFPLGILIYEVLNLIRAKNANLIMPTVIRSLYQFLACLSIMVWALFWGNFGPVVEVLRQNISTVSLFKLFPEHSLYFLSCLGFYFVIPEFILLKRKPFIVNLFNKKAIVVSLSLFILFLFFPPYQNVNYNIPTMGYMDKLFRLVGGNFFRMTLFYMLALMACLRFLAIRLESLLVLSNVFMMLKSHIAWDKYLLPLIVVLWFLNAIAHEDTAFLNPVQKEGLTGGGGRKKEV